MPLTENAEQLIRKSLEDIANGKKVRSAIIGNLTTAQLTEINKERAARKLPPINGKIFFVGRHVYKSRISENGYTIDDVVDQIVSGMSDKSVVKISYSRTALQNETVRDDRYGNKIRDRIALECTARNPLAELLSVIPIGDKVRPCDLKKQTKEAASMRPLDPNLTDSPG